MRYIFLPLLLLFTFINAKDYSIVIDEPFNDALLDITEDYDRQITAVGFSRNFKQSTESSKIHYDAFSYLESISDANGEKMHIIKADPQAVVTLNTQLKLSRFSKAVSVTKTPQNGYFVGGYTLDGSMVVLKLDPNSNIIFQKQFGTKYYNEMNTLIPLRDGGVLVVGTSKTTRSKSDDMFESGLGLSDIYVTRFSKFGHKLWSKKFGTQYDDIGVDAVEANDGSILILGKTLYDNNQNATLMRITQNGNKIWLKEYKSTQIMKPHKILQLRDGNFLISISQKTKLQKERIRLIKIDLHQNVIIDKILSTTYSSALKDIKEYSNSNLIGVGYVQDRYNTDALVMVLNSKLEMLNQEHHGDENFDMFNAVTILHNSEAAAAGIRTSVNSQESNMWIAKLNQDATLAQVSENLKRIHKKLQNVFEDEEKEKKVEIKKDLTIDIPSTDLYFEVGQYKLTDAQKKFLAKFYEKLIPFIKKYQNSIVSVEINGHTSSEWGDKGFVDTYLKNAKLSMQRSFSVTQHLFSTQDKPTQMWLTKVLRGSGYSYSKKVLKEGIEDKEKSRRVSFKLILRSS
jgi:outer membrane protein OmpA-like peptidoglycan-associated protein